MSAQKEQVVVAKAENSAVAASPAPVSPAKSAVKTPAKPPVKKAPVKTAPVKTAPAKPKSKPLVPRMPDAPVAADKPEPTKVAVAVKPAKAAKTAKATKPAKPAKVDKPVKAKKVKLVRDSYAMPEVEHARLGELKKRLIGLGVDVKKSELLRAGLAMLVALGDAELRAVVGRVERIKTGRPAK